MGLKHFQPGLALLAVLLTACVSSTAVVHEGDEASDAVYSWEEARADPSCVVPLCDEERCAVWRCRDVVEVEAAGMAEVPSVVLAKGTYPVVVRPLLRPLTRPSTGTDVTTAVREPWEPNPNRWWGHPVAAPTVADPVFEIPWHNWKTREPRVVKQLRHWQCNIRPKEPYEKHHIFPQAAYLARWFTRRKIDIHAFTIRLPRSFHQWLHSGGPDGGQWNEAWRQFHDNNRGATAEQMWAFAGELMSRFGVNGPLVPYYCD
ncbi:TIGR02269 family lipoprotein [Archangium sp.]|uniref:SitA6 family polymorphic toxin lipoprotein n=1 Tax=Archangium sp. TaxID=1872627 RepID=UPI00286A08F1|nr:TIGR02269 family lipoprotein [Archangium sp.]